MTKPRVIYECTNCAATYPKWVGRCSVCGSWDSVVGKTLAASPARGARHTASEIPEGSGPVYLSSVVNGRETLQRLPTGIEELDNILGGGMVPGSLLLLGGEPGIGKSTLMLQLASSMERSGLKVLYLSGEESASQIGMRAKRLGIGGGDSLLLLPETCFESIEQVILAETPSVLIVDSIQTVYVSSVEAIPGSIAQVRESSAGFMRLAKGSALTVFLVGHVTKDGSLAGPKMLEHMVDTVLYFEGDSSQTHRILRVVKNRFGSTNEIGLFEMRPDGLAGVKDLSGYFLSGRARGTPGTAIVCTVEGTRPLLVEVQALVTPTGYGTAQRVSTGYDSRRLAIMLAILEKRLGLPMASHDVFVSLAGGLKVYEPAVDLGVCLGLCSSLREKALDPGTVFVAEVGLSGELRPVTSLDRRLAESAKLGFERVICPSAQLDRTAGPQGLKVVGCDTLVEAVSRAFSPEGRKNE